MRALRGIVGLAIAVVAIGFADDAPKAQDPPKKVSKDEAMAAVVMKVDPPLPEVAKQLKIAGAVEMEVVIDEKGKVEQVNAIAGNPVLTKAAEAALRRWRFKPFMSNGKAVRAVAHVNFEFQQQP